MNENVKANGILSPTNALTLLLRAKNAKFSGRLTLQREAQQRAVFFRDGMLCDAACSDIHESLGYQLVGWGLISEKNCRESGERVLRGEGLQGEILVGMGAIAPQVLAEALHKHREKRLIDAIAWSNGKFEISNTGQSTDDSFALWPMLRKGIVKRYGAEGLQQAASKYASFSVQRTPSPYETLLADIPEVLTLLADLPARFSMGSFLAKAEKPMNRFADLCMLKALGLIRIGGGEKHESVVADGERLDNARRKVRARHAIEQGKADLAAGRFEKAVCQFHTAYTQSADPYPAALQAYAAFRFSPNNAVVRDRACTRIQASLAAGGDDSELLGYLGALLLLAGRYVESRTALDKAIVLDPDNQFAVHQLYSLRLRLEPRDKYVDPDLVDPEAALTIQRWVGPHAIIYNFKRSEITVGCGSQDQMVVSSSVVGHIVPRHCTISTVAEMVFLKRNRLAGQVFINDVELQAGKEQEITSSDSIILGRPEEGPTLELRLIDKKALEANAHKRRRVLFSGGATTRSVPASV